ncbi:fibronectin type III domain-containing protein, partial [Flavobacterium sp. J27]|uniref:fibronectin type III domain-containing protein n=1 Tax=Flavobacterium sp. J27 TaxID=2060419 RepID=UPI00197ABDD0
MKKITLWLFLLLFSTIGFAQIPIGNGNDEAQQLPFDPFYGYTYSQSIYTSAEINASGNITGLRWYFSGTSLLPSNQNLTIYLGHTTKTAFANTTDWEAFGSLTAVYTGGIPVTGPGWVNITFTTPFAYNGTDNLIVAVDENMAGYDQSGDDFYNTSSTAGRSIWYRSDSTNPDPATPPTGTLASYFPNVIFNGIAQACPQPIDLTASNITSSTVNLGWTVGASTQWEYVVQAQGTGMPTGSGVLTSNNPVFVSALTADTNYEFWVRTYCGVSEQSVWTGPFNFKTLCTTNAAPWSYDVETA